MKKIFTPFSRLTAGTLATALASDGKIKPHVLGKPDGRYKGFNLGDRVFAPKETKTKGVYERSQTLQELMGPDDQLYINAHCLRGIDYVSTNVKCDDGTKVTVDQLVAQLDALGLLTTTRCKIKLWVCEGGLDDGDKESFAKRFSKAMFTAGYTSCKIFGYPLSLFREYKSVGAGQGDDGLHKRAVQPGNEDEWKKKMRDLIKTEGKGSNLMLAKIWNEKVKYYAFAHKDHQEDAAADDILANESQRKLFGASLRPTPSVGARASSIRLEFSNGQIVRTPPPVTRNFPPLTFVIEEESVIEELF